MKTSSIYLTRNPNAINYSSPDLANKLLHYIGLNVLERAANRERAITICYDRCNGKETIVPNHAGTDQKWVAEDRTNHLMWSLLELRVRLD